MAKGSAAQRCECEGEMGGIARLFVLSPFPLLCHPLGGVRVSPKSVFLLCHPMGDKKYKKHWIGQLNLGTRVIKIRNAKYFPALSFCLCPCCLLSPSVLSLLPFMCLDHTCSVLHNFLIKASGRWLWGKVGYPRETSKTTVKWGTGRLSINVKLVNQKW